jgi:membrane protein implicated in regulation of membrane protease activity
MRKGLITIGVLVIVLGLAALVSGVVASSFVFVFWGLVLIAAIVFERRRYKRIARASPGPGWERTNERFVDDETGKTVTVYVRPQTGERTYVEEQ